jgi:hypothetical protein
MMRNAQRTKYLDWFLKIEEKERRKIKMWAV